MIALKLLLTVAGALLLAAALAIPLYGLWLRIRIMRRKEAGETESLEPEEIAWRTPAALVMVACLPLLIASSIVVVPSGMGGVRVSQISGTLPGTLFPGVHFITPLMDSVQTFDLRDHLFTAGVSEEGGKPAAMKNGLSVQSREGLNIGLSRYRALSPRPESTRQRAGSHAATGGQGTGAAGGGQRVARTGAGIHGARNLLDQARRGPLDARRTSSHASSAADGIVVEEVMLCDIQLPEEYAKGLEGLLLKEQEDDQMGVDTDIQQKQVKIAELQAEAEAVQKVKEAEGEAQSKVVEAKGEADAMQYTLPLKEKQIEQSKLEAEARKEATIQNAEADAQAKVIDSKAELERRNLLADAEASRIKPDGQGRRRTHDQRSGAAEQVAAADQQDHRRAALRQDPGGHGSFGRQILLRKRCFQKHGCESSDQAGDGQRTGRCAEEWRTLKATAPAASLPRPILLSFNKPKGGAPSPRTI